MISFLLSLFNSKTQDWANLKYYQSENEIITKGINDDNRVVFMGNSITQQWKEKRPDFFAQNPYICRGISGQTSPQMLVRFRQDVIALQPKVVVILAGTNDIAENANHVTLDIIMANLSSMAELANANKINVVMSSVLPVYEYTWKKEGQEPNIKIPMLNAMIKEYAVKKGFTYLDYFTPMADKRNGMKTELTTDGLHCNIDGYKVMEPLVQAAIAKAMQSK